MDPSYYDELEHLDIHCDISAPSGRVMWRPLEWRFGPLLRTALLTNISLWKIKNRVTEKWRARRSKGGRKGEERDPSIWNGRTKQAAGGFITQPGCLVPTLIWGPKLWVMNISCNKWANRNSWSVVGDTFACQPTAVTPPGVWRRWDVQGERASPPEACINSVLTNSSLPVVVLWF